jgi:hypothetical protein
MANHDKNYFQEFFLKVAQASQVELDKIYQYGIRHENVITAKGRIGG